jgi:hypothetical protein
MLTLCFITNTNYNILCACEVIDRLLKHTKYCHEDHEMKIIYKRVIRVMDNRLVSFLFLV